MVCGNFADLFMILKSVQKMLNNPLKFAVSVFVR